MAVAKAPISALRVATAALKAGLAAAMARENMEAAVTATGMGAAVMDTAGTLPKVPAAASVVGRAGPLGGWG